MGRRTNVGLLLLLAAAFASGWLAFAYAGRASRWSLVAHALAGFAIVLLIPWKSVISRRGLGRRRSGRPASLALAGLVLIAIAAGLAHSTGLLRWYGQITAMEVHVTAALAAVPLVAWHALARPQRLHTTDLSRRHLLRGGAVLGAAAVAYAASEGMVRVARLPGAERRLTGSYEFGSLRPEMLPVTQWLLDAVPAIEPEAWSLRLVAQGRSQVLGYAALAEHADRVRAVLDCTGGFYSEQDWEGVWLSRLVGGAGGLSLRVVSRTGYERRFALEEASRLLLATRLGGRPLDPGHGAPARLVAPGRRGFEWVKWVDVVAVEDLPAWWQLPFPLH